MEKVVSVTPKIALSEDKKSVIFSNIIKFENDKKDNRSVSIEIKSKDDEPFYFKLKPLVEGLTDEFIQDYYAKMLFDLRELGEKDEIIKEFIFTKSSEMKNEQSAKDNEEIEIPFVGGKLVLKKGFLMHGPHQIPYQGVFSIASHRLWVPPITNEKLKDAKNNSIVINSLKVGGDFSPMSIELSGTMQNFPITPEVSEKFKEISDLVNERKAFSEGTLKNKDGDKKEDKENGNNKK